MPPKGQDMLPGKESSPEMDVETKLKVTKQPSKTDTMTKKKPVEQSPPKLENGYINT